VETEIKPSQSLYKRALTAGLWRENPTFRLLLGMCPTLAVTSALKPALTMSVAVVFVLICSNVVISLIRNLLKPHLRILMFTMTIAAFVTIADLFLKAYLPDMSEALGPYVPLIIVNCIIMCRAEACASKNGLVVSVLDAIGMGAGFTISLSVLGIIREIISTGAVWEISVMPKSFVPWTALRLPVGAFITLGLLIGLMNVIIKRKSVPAQ
jgi:electron transport complex protein RnfE